MIKHSLEPTTNITKDGDVDAVVIRIRDTGSSLIPMSDRYKHTIIHGLNRIPSGCSVILSDKICNVKVVSKDSTKIIVQFTAEHADINLRIW